MPASRSQEACQIVAITPATIMPTGHTPMCPTMSYMAPDRVVAIASVAPAALAIYSPAALLCRSLMEAKTQWAQAF